MKQLAPKSKGDMSDIKALMEQLSQASISNTVVDVQYEAAVIDEEVPMSAIDDLRETTKMLMKLGDKGDEDAAKPTAGKSFNKRMSAVGADQMKEFCPDGDSEKQREDTLRETMQHIVKSQVRDK